jgi:ankyrin repeat protein
MFALTQHDGLPIVKFFIEFQNNNVDESKRFDYQECNENRSSLLHYAVQSDNVEIIDFIADFFLKSKQQEQTPDQITNEDGLTPLLVAVAYGKLTSVHHLISKYNSNPLVKNLLSSNILHYYALQNDVKIVDYVMSIKGVPELINEHNQADANILHFACSGDSVELVDYIISLDPSRVESVDKGGQTPLFYAALHNQPQMFQHLIDNHNVNAHHRLTGCKNLMGCAILTDNPEMIKLVSKSFETHPTPRYYDRIVGNWQYSDNVLHKALGDGKLQSMRELIRLKANLLSLVDAFPHHSLNLLYNATQLKNEDGTRNYEFVEYLLSDELMKDWLENALVDGY